MAATVPRRVLHRPWGLGAALIGTMTALVIATLAGPSAEALTTHDAAPASPASPAAEEVVVEVFWGDGCPHCEHLLDFLDVLAGELDGFVVETHEVWYDANGRALLFRRAAELELAVEAVPFTIVDGREAWVGYTPAIGRQIDEAVRAAVARRSSATGERGGSQTDDPVTDGFTDETVIDLPLMGDVDLTGRSLVLTTVLIGFVDGFNPCSLWVLTVLLALVLHTGSRRRVVLIGGSFLLVTTLAYGLFMIGVYSALSVIGSLGWIRGMVAVFALAFGLINVKDYFWFKVGPSMTIADEHKPGIYRRGRALVRPDVGLPAAMLGAAGMALGVSLLETPCTAGFPVIWSEQVHAAGVSSAAFAVLLGLYLLIFLIDELLVFGAAVVTMRATRMQERHGRALKLVAGMVMIAIAVTILVSPATMDTPLGVLAVFGLALVASVVVAGIRHTVTTRSRPDSFAA